MKEKLSQFVNIIVALIGYAMLLLLANGWSWIGLGVLLLCALFLFRRSLTVEVTDKDNLA